MWSRSGRARHERATALRDLGKRPPTEGGRPHAKTVSQRPSPNGDTRHPHARTGHAGGWRRPTSNVTRSLEGARRSVLLEQPVDQRFGTTRCSISEALVRGHSSWRGSSGRVRFLESKPLQPTSLVRRIAFGQVRDRRLQSNKCSVELGGIEPPSNSLRTNPIRPFPLHTYAGVPAGRLLTPSSENQGWATNRLSESSAVFLAVSGLSHRHPSLLLPGCDGLAPCGIAAHDDSPLV